MATIKPPNMYISYRGVGVKGKCYSFDLPYIQNEQINYLELEMVGKLLGVNGFWQRKSDFTLSFHLINT